MITNFRGEYRFLSNFYLVDIFCGGQCWKSVEHAYQAAKTLVQSEKMWIFAAFSPGEAKKRGEVITIRSDWDQIKLSVMEDLLRRKFSYKQLQDKLLLTGNEILVEENTWHDIFWGKCICNFHQGTGENHLGKLLMEIRRDLTPLAIAEIIDNKRNK